MIAQVLAGTPGKGFPPDLFRVARICFVWTEKGPENVEIVDYH